MDKTKSVKSRTKNPFLIFYDSRVFLVILIKIMFMKVLHVTYSNHKDGAAIAVARLHKALLKTGIDSTILSVRCSKKTERSIPALGSTKLLLNRIINRILWKLFSKIKKDTLLAGCSLNIFPTGLHRKINSSDADIVHLHWINNEMISIKEIAKITKPIVWTLHDMWAFCGIEHYSTTERYKDGYKKINANSKNKLDRIDFWIWKQKQKAWGKSIFNFVTPSHWLSDCVLSSKLLGHHPIKVIPNPFDIDIFSPQDQIQAREILNLPQDKTLILIGAASLSVKYKGMDLFIQSLNYINTEFDIVVFGGVFETSSKHTVHQMGAIWDEKKMASLYSAVDLFVLPSRIDNFPSTGVESLACGTPVVAFNIGGLPDMINHKKNGYLATPFDVKDLANGIDWISTQLNKNNKAEYQTLCSKARDKVIRSFSEEIVAEKYTNLYTQLLLGKNENRCV